MRAKLPSRNWCIFWAVCGAVSGTIAYDRYHTNLVKQKWINAVSHLASQPLAPSELPRKVTVYLSAPPGDGLQAARDHFREYVKPVLNAAAVDFDVVEGRKVGELRYKVAEEVRGKRRGDAPDATEELRQKLGVMAKEEPGVVVVGRHAWKEYLRGLHEGWLGPLEAPAPPPVEKQEVKVESIEEAITPPETTEEEKKAEDEKKKKLIPPPFIRPEEYATAALPRDVPEHFEPAGIVPFPHILGFLNTPIRIYRFVTRRRMADAVCREAAAVALGAYRPVTREEVEEALVEEEKDWPARVWKEEKYQGEWTEPLVVDERIRERLRRFYVPNEMEPKEPAPKEEEA
jgi:import inner membrane translocase subunit TIM54